MIRVGFTVRRVSAKRLRIMLDALVRLNLDDMHERRFPPLYKSGVRYRREPKEPGKPEQWQTITELYARRFGDCEDLASARVAELRMQGIRAVPWLLRRPGSPTWHVVVRYPSGKIEDPSRLLGMGKDRNR